MKKKPRHIRHKISKWHRRVGVTASIFILLVAITGIPLNHTESLGLDKVKVGNALVIFADGDPTSYPSVGFSVGDRKLIWYRGNLYLEEAYFAGGVDKVVGVATVGGALVVAAKNELFLFKENGLLIEKISGANIPGKIQKVGTRSGAELFLLTRQGQYVGVDDYLEWLPTDSKVSWSKPITIDNSIKKLQKKHQIYDFTWSKILLDIHTGRAFGKLGPYLMDLAALSLIFLLVTGVYKSIFRN